MNWQELSSSFANLWQTELYKAGDTQIYLSQVIIAFSLIVIGFIIVRWLGAHVVKRALKNSSSTENTVYAFRKLFSILAYILIVLIALPIAGIPITVFAVMGGALAIGVGFGAQNLLNNLISGVILIAERPIRIGDIVELEKERGRVEEIGNRCVRIRRYDGVHVLVPNSYFLEQRVVNWTLVSADIRSVVTVGVAYGSPVQKVHDLMLEAAVHDKVSADYPVEVFFDNFGDNALVFNLFFWTSVHQPMDIRRVQSDVRFNIERLFAENGVVVAFPQRDVHLDTSKPLEIHLKDPSEQKKGS
ncbi:mechanosensitive ion channel family protein [Idiomarina seosinensis]|uniref:Mechanosensitive ion channel protein n=1 Tax=Idiomarina seosinensis TaxID=281739 RepID=A0A432ZBP5_9GAMM|nr:mechanosensitive ion channel domain-containing protein [Idiomarina seosinensis]RUO75365.1 mechanosensitive ion channel protein [Idiomarina seosinensis]